MCAGPASGKGLLSMPASRLASVVVHFDQSATRGDTGLRKASHGKMYEARPLHAQIS